MPPSAINLKLEPSQPGMNSIRDTLPVTYMDSHSLVQSPMTIVPDNTPLIGPVGAPPHAKEPISNIVAAKTRRINHLGTETRCLELPYLTDIRCRLGDSTANTEQQPHSLSRPQFSCGDFRLQPTGEPCPCLPFGLLTLSTYLCTRCRSGTLYMIVVLWNLQRIRGLAIVVRFHFRLICRNPVRSRYRRRRMAVAPRASP